MNYMELLDTVKKEKIVERKKEKEIVVEDCWDIRYSMKGVKHASKCFLSCKKELAEFMENCAEFINIMEDCKGEEEKINNWISDEIKKVKGTMDKIMAIDKDLTESYFDYTGDSKNEQ